MKRSAEAVEGAAVEPAIASMCADPAIEYLNLPFAKPAARVARALVHDGSRV